MENLFLTIKDLKEFALDDLKRAKVLKEDCDSCIPTDYLAYKEIIVKLVKLVDNIFDRYYSASVERENYYVKLSKIEDPTERTLRMTDYYQLLGQFQAYSQIVNDLIHFNIIKKMEEQ